MSDFIDPSATIRKDFTVGDKPYWIEIKPELSFGEEQTLAGILYSGRHAGQPEHKKTPDVVMSMELKKAAVEKVFTWVTAWSCVNAAGKSVQITREAIGNLKPSVAEAINDLIDAQMEANEAVGKTATGAASTP